MSRVRGTVKTIMRQLRLIDSFVCEIRGMVRVYRSTSYPYDKLCWTHFLNDFQVKWLVSFLEN